MPSSPGQTVRNGCPGARRAAGRSPVVLHLSASHDPGVDSTSHPVRAGAAAALARPGIADKCHAGQLIGDHVVPWAESLTLLETTGDDDAGGSGIMNTSG